MLNAAELLPGEVLLDPMCGTGMLLTEAPMHCHVLGLWARQMLFF
jgi:tRNA G10  N-methylase Trm11